MRLPGITFESIELIVLVRVSSLVEIFVRSGVVALCKYIDK